MAFGAFFRNLSRWYLIGGAFALIVVVALLMHGISHTPTTNLPPPLSHVRIASVASLSGNGGALPVTGTVSSKSHATVLAQTGGEIVSLSHSLGDYVSAGSIIAAFENSIQQAAVLQAEGAYEATLAALSKTQGADASGNAKASAIAALSSAYGALDDAVHTKADTLFSNPRSSSPQLLGFTIPNSQLVVNIQSERSALEGILSATQVLPGASDTGASIAAMLGAAQSVQAFLNDLITAMNSAVPNQDFSASVIAADQATLSAARAEVTGAVSSLAAAKSAYDSATASANSGANTSDLAAAHASVKSAQGTLDAAKAALEKTIARAPISGTIVSLPVKQGDYVTAFAPVAQISNPSALEVDAYVTSDDAATLAVGGKAAIDGSVPGAITFIAPALDPATGKIEVKIGLSGSSSSVSDGDTVSVSLERSEKALAAPAAGAPVTIPIVAAKITPSGAVVFTVASSTLHAMPITLGTILGDTVIVQGLSPDTAIVTDARGLSDGQTVAVDQ